MELAKTTTTTMLKPIGGLRLTVNILLSKLLTDSLDVDGGQHFTGNVVFLVNLTNLTLHR